MNHRAYSILEIKAADDEKRIITGVATTPSPDRVGDVVEPLGVKFKNPLPLLWQHRSDQPVGNVKFDKPTKDGITFQATMPKIADAGPLKDRVDTAWGEVKAGLVRGVSIGFRSIEHSYMDDGGIHFLETEVLELSLVTIPANESATIQTIKSIDEERRKSGAIAEALVGAARALSGRQLRIPVTGEKTASGPDRSDQSPAGVTARKSTLVVKATEARPMTKKTLAEQISAFQSTKQTKSARMDEIMDDAAEKGETLDAQQKEEYDTLAKEVEEIDEHLKRLDAAQKRAATTAKAVDGTDPQKASESRGSGNGDAIRVSVKPNVEKGIQFARAVWCKVHGHMQHRNAADVAKEQSWHDQTPEVERYLRTAVAAGNTTDTTWASPLVEETNLVSEFAEFLRPATIIGRIPGLTRVPFNIKVPRETTAASASWVGEGDVKPVSAMAFDQITLLHNKIAGIVPVTEELFRFSSPSVDGIIRTSLRDAIVYLMDRDFLDPTKSETVGVSPASITNGVTPIAATGTTADALRADLGSMLTEYTEANHSLSTLVLVMTASQAMRIALMRNTLGQREFEGIGRDGGTLEGIPVVVSENIVSVGGSPTDGSYIVAVDAREILLADDGGVNIDVSREASLQMNTAPDSPETASTILVSLWQRNMIALKAERFITWKKRRSTAVQLISHTKYA